MERLTVGTARERVRTLAIVGALVMGLGGTSVATASGAAAASVHRETVRLPSISTIATLSAAAGFATVDTAHLTATLPVRAVPLTPEYIVKLGQTDEAAYTDGHGVFINSPSADSTTTVVKAGSSGLGFGIVTTRHTLINEHFRALRAVGTTMITEADGGLRQMDANGKVVGEITPATAVDSNGHLLPASYTVDPINGDLTVHADTRHAVGTVFIDPSWRCWSTAGAWGLGWVVIAAAWIFTWDVPGITWALTSWWRLSYGSANSIAIACAQ